jgi:hypothetical protein
MTRTSTLFSLVLLCMVILGSAASGIERGDVTFYAPFEDEDSNDAQIAAGSPRSRTASGSTVLVPGKRGSGLLLYGKSEPLVYETAGNIDETSGTVAVWFKAIDWGKGDPFQRRFFSVGGKERGFAVILYKFWTHLYFYVQHNYEGSKKLFIPSAPNYDFERGAWTHLAGTWDGNNLSLFVNGEYVSSAIMPIDSIVKGKFDETFIIGSESQRDGSPADTVLDEFYIFRRALSRAEVRQLYELGFEAIGKPVEGAAVELIDCTYVAARDCLRLQGILPMRRVDDPRRLSATIEILDGTGRKTAHPVEKMTFSGNRVKSMLTIGSLAPGEYKAAITVYDDGKKLGTAEKSFEKIPRPEWTDNTLGVTDEIPRPWTPIRHDGSTVGIWGREYSWDDSLFPAQMVTQGQKLLARPVTLKAVAKGRDVPVTGEQVTWTRKGPGSIELAASGKIGPLSVTADWWIEYDGFAWCALTLSGSSRKDLESLVLEVPLRVEIATLQNLNIVPDNLDRAGRLTPLSAPLQKHAFIWLGNEIGGLQWSAETDRTWRLADKRNQFEVVPGEKEVILRVHLVDHPVSLDEPLEVEFGLQATPVKPRPADWREFDWTDDIFWPQWNDNRHGYLVPRDNIMKYVRTIEQSQFPPGSRRMNFIYLNLMRVWKGTPELANFLPEWSAQGEWKPAGGESETPCRASRSLQDYWLWRLKKSLDDNPEFAAYIKGIYMDTTPPNFCLNRLHGCAIENEKGEPVGKYAVLGARRFQQRLYVMLQRHFPSYRTIQHQSEKMQMCQLAFVDAVVDGEHVGSAAGQALERDLNYYNVPWFNLGAMRAEFMGKNLGFVPIFLPQTSRRIGGGRADPEKMVKVIGAAGIPASEHVVGMLLAHDIVAWPAYMNGIPFARLKALKERFGWDREVEFLPYWANEKYVSLATSVQPAVCSLYRRGDTLLVVVMNNSDRDAEAVVRLDLKALGMQEAPEEALDIYRAVTVKCEVVSDESILARTPKPEYKEIPGTVVKIPVKDGVLTFDLEKRNFRAFEIAF